VARAGRRPRSIILAVFVNSGLFGLGFLTAAVGLWLVGALNLISGSPSLCSSLVSALIFAIQFQRPISIGGGMRVR